MGDLSHSDDSTPALNAAATEFKPTESLSLQDGSRHAPELVYHVIDASAVMIQPFSGSPSSGVVDARVMDAREHFFATALSHAEQATQCAEMDPEGFEYLDFGPMVDDLCGPQDPADVPRPGVGAPHH